MKKIKRKSGNEVQKKEIVKNGTLLHWRGLCKNVMPFSACARFDAEPAVRSVAFVE
jgi:hypothetical protein